MTKPFLSLAVIARNAEETIYAMLESAYRYVDEIVIVWGGQNTDKTEDEALRWADDHSDYTSLIFTQFNEHIGEDGGLEHFGEARNYSFSLTSGEWIMFLDTDDTLVGGDHIKELLETTEDVVDAWVVPYDYARDEFDNRVIYQEKERIFRRRSWEEGARWTYRAHEVYRWQWPNPRKLQCGRSSSFYGESLVVKHDPNHRDDRSPRNRHLLRMSMKDPNILYDSRTWMEFGRYYLLGREPFLKRALPYFKRALEFDLSPEDRYFVLHGIADVYKHIGRFREARLFYLECLFFPHWKDAYLGLAECDLSLQAPQATLYWLEIASHLQPRDSRMAYSPLKYEYDYYRLKGLAYLQMEDLDNAYPNLSKASEILPSQDKLAELHQTLIDIKVQQNVREMIDALMTLGTIKFSDYPPYVMERRSVRDHVNQPIHDSFVKDGVNTIIFCGAVAEPWSPNSLNQGGIGGSETAVIYLAQKLAKDGKKVVVYTDPQVDEGIFWKNAGFFDYRRFRPDIKCKNFISWRRAPMFAPGLDTEQRILWNHDINLGARTQGLEEAAEQFDRIVGVSPWHEEYLRTLYPRLGEHIYNVPNGIDLGRFTGAVERDPHKFIYTSCPKRGLYELLEMWPYIRQYEDDRLHVFYGFQGAEFGDKGLPPEASEYTEAIRQRLRTTTGVVERGRIGQKELAQEFLSANMWLYPTSFAESCCCVGSTLVDLPRDYQKYPMGIPIEELVGKSNFPVWSYDNATGVFKLCKVEWVRKTGENVPVIRINFRGHGRPLRVTPEHRILTYNRGWVSAKDLVPGERIVSLGKRLSVEVGTGEGPWKQEHRLLAEWKFGGIPLGDHVDHIDGNAFNNSPENVQILDPSTHAKKSLGSYGDRRPIHSSKLVTRAENFKNWLYQNQEEVKLLRSKAGHALWDNMTLEQREKFSRMRSRKRNTKEPIFRDCVTCKIKFRIPESRIETAKYCSKVCRNIGHRKSVQQSNHVVESIVPDGTEDVYNMEVNGLHNFVAEGVVIHNCIGAIEAQAAGCLPITSHLGGLISVVSPEIVTIPGSNTSMEYQQKFLSMVAYYRDHPEEADILRSKLKTFARRFSWGEAYAKWKRILK